jgi:pyruvate/oxaloacetate carboxyltransferase
VLPSYIDADLDSDAGKANAGSKLLALVKLIRSGNTHSQSGTEISARSLTQLPEQAILRYLREQECDLDLALEFFERFVLSEQNQSKRYEDKDANPEDDAEEFEGIELRGRKRNLKIVLEEDSTIDKLEEVLAELRRRAKEMTGQVKKQVGDAKEIKEVPL